MPGFSGLDHHIDAIVSPYNGDVAEKPFHDPQLALNRIYTRRGDTGETSLVGGQRVGKDSLRIECYGAVDELNAVLGLVAVSVAGQAALRSLAASILRIQHELFNLGSLLATLPADLHPNQPRVTNAEVRRLETEMDEMNGELAPLRSFVLAGGARLNAELHLARTVCRRAERLAVALSRQEEVDPDAVRYLNRLSDALFVYSRWVSLKMGSPEVLWEPNQSASGQGS
jgi:cob(I)alamin adenosyltransferase